MEADTDESIPRKKEATGTPSVALGRAPDAEPPPAPGVLLRAALMSVGQMTSLDDQLEAYLLGTEPQPQLSSKARPLPARWHLRAWTWEDSWPDSESLYHGLEHDRQW